MSVALVTYPPAKVLSKNPILYQVQSTAFSGLNNYRIVFRVLFEKTYASGTYEQIVELEDTPDGDGFTTWNIQAIIEATLIENTVLQVPDISDNTSYLADNIRRFKIEFAEKYGSPAVIQSFTASSVSSAIHGGIDMQIFADTDYINGIDISNPFLTWLPDGQKVSSKQAVYLTWHNYTGSTVGLIREASVYNANNVLVQTITPDETSVGINRSLVVPIGPEQLGITDPDAVKYTVSFLDSLTGDAPVSGDRTFYIDKNPAHCERSALWFNSFNQPETLRLTGRTTVALSIDRQEFTRTLPFNYSPIIGEIMQHSADWANTFTYRTGYLRKKEVDALQDLLVRNLLFEITDDGYYRMHLTDKKYHISECLQFLHQLQMEAVRSLKAINFSRVAISGTPAGHWELSNTGFYLTASGGRFELAQ